MLDHLMPLLASPWLYAVVFVIVAIDGFFPVVPSETVVIGLGALSATGTPNVVALAAAAAAGGMAGDRFTYLLGSRAGRRVTHGKLAVAKRHAERALLRYGGAAILAGRFLPYGRTATAMTAGSVALPLGRFRLFTGLASLGWAAYALGLGRLGGATFAHQPLLGAAFGVLLGMALAALVTMVEKRKSAGPKLKVAGLKRRVAGIVDDLEHEAVGRRPEAEGCGTKRSFAGAKQSFTGTKRISRPASLLPATAPVR
jgi:membrane-associated protein